MISDRGAKISKAHHVYTFGNMLDTSFLKTKLAFPLIFLINTNGKLYSVILEREEIGLQ